MLDRIRAGSPRAIALAALALVASAAHATIRHGDVQLSGNVEQQTLIRTPDFDQLHPVQQRNTFRLQYEHQLVQRGKLFKQYTIPGISSASLFSYYRFVFDSAYYIQPGGRLEASDGSTGGTLRDSNRSKRDIAFENAVREIFLDVKLSFLPVSFRIGRQQMNWGEADQFRALDSVNPIDLSWHLQQEAGLIGKVGFDELRVPLWAIKMLVDLGTIGSFDNVFLEAYDDPFDFQQSKVRFLPQPWSLSLRNPFRPGLVVDAGAQTGLAPGLLLVEPCFDRSGSTASNAAVGLNFNDPALQERVRETGLCDSTTGPHTTTRQGFFDRHDPVDVNQFGVRLSGNTSFGATVGLAYMHRRHYFDLPGAGQVKIRQGALLANPSNFVAVNPISTTPTTHSAFDPITKQATPVLGYLRIPIEYYMPYVDVVGFSTNYADDHTGTVFRAEATWTHGFPIADVASPNVMVKKDVMLGMVGFDKPTWIQFLNPRSTWLITGQFFMNWIPDHDDTLVQAPNITVIPGQFRAKNTLDHMKRYEMLSTLIATTFYRGGSVVPVIAVVPQWSYMPTFAFIFGAQIYLTNNLIFTPALRIYTTPNGDPVDEPYGIGRLGKWDEMQLKLTYQF